VDNILGDIKKGVEDAFCDPDWVVTMQEELNNFKRNKVWSLVERPKLNIVATKCRDGNGLGSGRVDRKPNP
jgi:hypothetical protein